MLSCLVGLMTLTSNAYAGENETIPSVSGTSYIDVENSATVVLEDISSCGEIKKFKFSNGDDDDKIENNKSYDINDLPNNFYIDARAEDIGSVKFIVTNLDTNHEVTIIENTKPFTYPGGGGAWDLGVGNFKVVAKGYWDPNATGSLCDTDTIYFTLTDGDDCGHIANFEFKGNNGDSVAINNNDVFNIGDLPEDFFFQVNGNAGNNFGSVGFTVKNLDTGEMTNITENTVPWNFPNGGDAWNLGAGTFQIDARAYSDDNQSGTQCDAEWVTFTLEEGPDCGHIRKFQFKGSDGESVTVEDNDTFDIGDLPEDFYFRVIGSDNNNFGSVKFTVKNLDTGEMTIVTDNSAAWTYPLDGNAWDLGVGTFQIDAKVYSEDDLGGVQCDAEWITFTLEEDCGQIDFIKFTDGAGNEVAIEDGGTYALSDLPDNVYIEAMIAGTAGSVKFFATNLTTGESGEKLENIVPYDFNVGFDFTPGDYRVDVSVFEESNAEGDRCDVDWFHFTITDGSGDECVIDDSEEETTFNGFNFVFNGSTNNIDGTSTWSYTVTGVGASKDLSHWILALCDELDEQDVVDTVPSSDVEIGTDPTTQVYGIKWDKEIDKNGGTKTFEFTLNGQYASELVEVAFKAGTQVYYCSITGPGCETENICDVDAGTISPDLAEVSLENGTATISATPDGNSNVPDGYEVVYVLTQGEDLVIINSGDAPTFEVSEVGKYTIHTLVYDPNTLDLGVIDFGTTTGGEIAALLFENGGSICGSLDVAGAMIMVMQEGCDAIACTMTPDSPLACIGQGDDSVTISATGNDDGNTPNGFEEIYILTFGNGLEIWDINTDAPIFDVTIGGDYRIHKLVYDPATFDPIAAIELNVTTGFDIVNLIESEGICADLDTEGARVWVDKPITGTLTAVEDTVSLDDDSATIAATPNGDIFIPSGFSAIYILTTGPDDTLIGVSDSPSFVVNNTGDYVIRTLIYDPEFLMDITSIYELGVTTLAELSEPFTIGEYCGVIDLLGAPITVVPGNCSAQACTMTPTSPLACIGNGDDSTTISATSNNDGNTPDGFEIIYVLTFGNGLEIWDVNTEPSFDVSISGDYRIHKLVYNPATFDPLSAIELNVTTGFDVVDLIETTGICADLDVDGARVWVDKPLAGTLTAVESQVTIDDGTAIVAATPNGDISVPSGYTPYYFLVQDDIVIQAGTNPSFIVTELGTYSIHTLVYDPEFLTDITSIYNLGTSTVAETIEPFLSEEFCGDFDHTGATITVGSPSCNAAAAELYSPEAISCIDDSGFATLWIDEEIAATVPDGFEEIYLVTSAWSNTILEVATNKDEINLSTSGYYVVKSLVYDPTTFDINSIEFGRTNTDYVSSQFIQNGGDICGSIEAWGSLHLVLPDYYCAYYFSVGRNVNEPITDSNVLSVDGPTASNPRLIDGPSVTGISKTNLRDQLTRFKSNEESDLHMMETLFPVKMYPNPAKEVLNINIQPIEKEVLDVKVYDLRGRLMYSGEMEAFAPGAHNIDVSNLRNGVYIAKFKSTHREVIKRFVVAN